MWLLSNMLRVQIMAGYNNMKNCQTPTWIFRITFQKRQIALSDAVCRAGATYNLYHFLIFWANMAYNLCPREKLSVLLIMEFYLDPSHIRRFPIKWRTILGSISAYCIPSLKKVEPNWLLSAQWNYVAVCLIPRLLEWVPWWYRFLFGDV